MYDKDVRRIAAQRLAKMQDQDALERWAIDAPTRQEKAASVAADMRQREELLSWADRQRKVNDQKIREQLQKPFSGHFDVARAVRATDPQYIPAQDETVPTYGYGFFGDVGGYAPIEELRAAGQLPPGTTNPRSRQYRTLEEPYSDQTDLTPGRPVRESSYIYPMVAPPGTYKKK